MSVTGAVAAEARCRARRSDRRWHRRCRARREPRPSRMTLHQLRRRWRDRPRCRPMLHPTMLRRSRLRRSRQRRPRQRTPRQHRPRRRRSRRRSTRLHPTRPRPHQATASQALLAFAAACHAVASNTRVPSARPLTNWFRPAFGFGGFFTTPASSGDVDLTDAEGALGRLRLRGRRHHERALDLIGRPARMLSHQHRRRSRNDRGCEGRSAQLHVAGRGDVVCAGQRQREPPGPVRPCTDRAPPGPASRSRPACTRRPRTELRCRHRRRVLEPMSAAPTVITNGSLPGANETPLGPAVDP